MLKPIIVGGLWFTAAAAAGAAGASDELGSARSVDVYATSVEDSSESDLGFDGLGLLPRGGPMHGGGHPGGFPGGGHPGGFPGGGHPGGFPGGGHPGGFPGGGHPGGFPGGGHPGGFPGGGHPGGFPGGGHPGGFPGGGHPGGGWHPPTSHPWHGFPSGWHTGIHNGMWRTGPHRWGGEFGHDYWRYHWPHGIYWENVWRPGWWWGGDWGAGWVPQPNVNDQILFCGSDPSTDEVYQCSVPGPIASVYITDTFSDVACVNGENWGVYEWGVWTRRGCQANFQVFFY